MGKTDAVVLSHEYNILVFAYYLKGKCHLGNVFELYGITFSIAALISPLQVSQILYDSLRPQWRNFIFEQLS